MFMEKIKSYDELLTLARTLENDEQRVLLICEYFISNVAYNYAYLEAIRIDKPSTGMYFGLINKNALENKRIIGNNATLGIYTDDINKAFEKAKQIGATILYEPSYVQDSPYKYICFGMLDLEGNMIEVANYEK